MQKNKGIINDDEGEGKHWFHFAGVRSGLIESTALGIQYHLLPLWAWCEVLSHVNMTRRYLGDSSQRYREAPHSLCEYLCASSAAVLCTLPELVRVEMHHSPTRLSLLSTTSCLSVFHL